MKIVNEVRLAVSNSPLGNESYQWLDAFAAEASPATLLHHYLWEAKRSAPTEWQGSSPASAQASAGLEFRWNLSLTVSAVLYLPHLLPS